MRRGAAIRRALIFFAASTDLARQGYTRKAREQRMAAMQGVGALFALVIVLVVYVSTCLH